MKSRPETTRRHIVVNADDFGTSHRINRAILIAFEKGFISSATIMANMPAFEEACQIVRNNDLQHRIGLHLNFTIGRPLTAQIAECRRFCDADGGWRPKRMVLGVSREEAQALETEIAAQVSACERNGITPTHWDSHQHMHTEFGIAPVVIRMAKRFGVGALRPGQNCGPGREGASTYHRVLANAYRSVYNARLRFHGLCRTEYFGDARDTRDIIRTTRADTEVMVHPNLDQCDRLVDIDGEDLKSRIDALRIPAEEMCSYYDVSAQSLRTSCS
jgi:chitin disaccharide deacetylase